MPTLLNPIMRAFYAWFNERETKKCVRTAALLPLDLQKNIASNVLINVYKMSYAIDRAYEDQASLGSDDSVRDDLTGGVRNAWLREAQTLRHDALKMGATSYTDPTWLAAALLESYISADSGHFGAKAKEQDCQCIIRWAGTVLTEGETEELKLLAKEQRGGLPEGLRQIGLKY